MTPNPAKTQATRKTRNEVERVDVLVAGGGIAGLVATIAFAGAGFRTLCIDPAPPITDERAEGADIRTTAFMQPSRDLLERIGLWPRLAPHAAPLQVMRIVEAGGRSAEAREIADFDASEISDEPFAWNLPNWLLRREMLGHLASLPLASFRPGVALRNLLARSSEAIATLSEGSRVKADLVIAADGRDSPIREMLGIEATTWRYGQKALVFTVSHPKPHQNISTEIHRSGGPFTLVPLQAAEDGRHRSAVVWMDRGPKIRQRQSLSPEELSRAATERSAGILGPLTVEGPRAVWPIITRFAHGLTGPRTALVAEAAHVVPPIGAQGLNLSLADIAALLDLAEGAPAALGNAAMLEAYSRQRKPLIRARVQGIDLLNRASIAGAPLLEDLRRIGIRIIRDTPPIRQRLMRAGMGPGLWG